MKNMLRTFLILFLLTGLTACFARTSPVYDLTISYPEDAPPEYKLGWQQGCESGLSTYSNDYYKSMYKFKQDLSMMKSEYYSKAWNDSFNYCRSYVNRKLAGDNLNYEENPTLFSTKNLDVTNSGKRANSPILATGLTGGQDNRGMFSGMFEAYAPGQGSMKWGSSSYNCDWLNRCGDDKPKDPVGAWWGDW